MTPSSSDGRASDETREAPSSNAKKMWRKVATPVRSATKIASALVGGFFWQGDDEGDGFEGGAKENRTMDVGRAMDEERGGRTRGIRCGRSASGDDDDDGADRGGRRRDEDDAVRERGGGGGDGERFADAVHGDQGVLAPRTDG